MPTIKVINESITQREDKWIVNIKTSVVTKLTKPNIQKTIPRVKIKNKGFMLKEVMPSIAKLSIFFNGYLLSPANLSPLSYSTVVDLKPTCGTIPRRNKFFSVNCKTPSSAVLLKSL